MLRLVLLVCFVAAAAAVPVESDTEFCNGQTECPQDCGYVSRNEKCVFCRCGDSPLVQPPEPVPLPEPEPLSCQHGQSFIDECDNDCKCIADGKYGCTRKLCKPGQTSEKPKTCSGAEGLPKRTGQRVFCHEGIVKTQPSDADCLPGAVFKDAEDCNTCRCTDRGVAGCTFKLCITPEPKGPTCQHGQSFIDECDNDCKCIADGKYGCTRKLCRPGQTSEKPKTCSGADGLPKRTGQRVFCHEGIVKTQPSDADCLPGAVFKDAEDCNTCRCTDKGVAGCTFKLCITPEPKGPTCEHGQSFIDECDNDCKCIADGKYGCTRKLCKPGQTSEKPKSCSGADGLPKRTGQRVFCHEGIVKTQPTDADCLPGSVFKDKEDCNTCRCSDPGVAACTLKFCVKPGPEGSTCQHGQSFIDECDNDCKCIADGKYGCTRKLCKPGQTSEKPKTCSGADGLPKRTGQRVFCHEGIVKTQPTDAKCLPGSVFKDKEDCNTCRCSDSGEAACTLRACIDLRTDSSCSYGSGFIDECNNDCNCVNNEFYGCTFKACKPGERPEVPMRCTSSDNLPSRAGAEVVCEDGIVKLHEKKCRYGDEYIDECDNNCRCLEGKYACTRKECQAGQISMMPMSCSGTVDLPYRAKRRVFCHEGIVKVQDNDETCLAGAVFNDECNECFCSDTGKSGCTLKACVGEESESTVTCEDGLPECPQDCGQSYNKARDCYDCPCAIGNPGDVTVMPGEPCPPGTVLTESGPFFSTCGPSTKCPHGLEFIDECGNDCTCGGDGYGCTYKACQPGQTGAKPMTCASSADLPERKGKRVFCHDGIVKLQNKEDSCIPKSLFKEDCNSCFCGEQGQMGCTLKECAPKQGACAHGKSFIDECDNDCECVKGESYGCTRKACKPGQTAEKPMTCSGADDLPQRAGRRVMCHEGIVKTQEKDAECLPGSTYKEECNTCTCGGACTLKACIL